jgi:hypothetical protein
MIKPLLVVLVSSVTLACGGSAVVQGGGGSGGEGGSGGASTACTLPATAVIPPVCLACIKTSCPTVYADLCTADCGANETSPACLSAQKEIGTCLQQPNCEFECMATHGSAVGGSSGVGTSTAGAGN